MRWSGVASIVVACALPLASPASAVAQADRLVRLVPQVEGRDTSAPQLLTKDGRLLWTGSTVWDVATGGILRILPSNAAVSAQTLSVDGTIAVAGYFDGSVVRWNLVSGERIVIRPAAQPDSIGTWGKAYVNALAISPNGDHLVVSDGENVELYALDPPYRLNRIWRQKLFPVNAAQKLAFLSDNMHFVASDAPGSLKFWSWRPPQPVPVPAPFDCPSSDSECPVDMSNDGRWILLSQQDNRWTYFNTETRRTGSLVTQWGGSKLYLPSASSEIAVVVELNDSAAVVNLTTGEIVTRVKGGLGYGSSSIADISVDGSRVLQAVGGALVLRDLRTGKTTATFRSRQQKFIQLEPLPGISVMAAWRESERSQYFIRDGVPRLPWMWDFNRGVAFNAIDDFDAKLGNVTADGKWVLSEAQQDGFPCLERLILEVINFRCPRTKAFPAAQVLADDRRRVMTYALDESTKRVVRYVWSFDAPDSVRQERLAYSETVSLRTFAVSSNGRFVAGIDERTEALFIWDTEKTDTPDGWRSYSRFRGVGSVPASDRVIASISREGRFIVETGASGTAVWNTDTESSVELELNGERPTSFQFLPEAALLLATNEDGTIKIWDADTGAYLASLSAFSDGTWAVVDRDGRYDASDPDESVGLHWVVGMEVIELRQLKARFFVPGLLTRIYRRQPMPDVRALQVVKPPPTVEVRLPAADQKSPTVLVHDDSGGVGRVVVKINGRQILSVDRPRLDSNGTARIAVPLDEATLRDGNNIIEAIAYDADNLIASRPVSRDWDRVLPSASSGVPSSEPGRPALFAIVAGASQYANSGMNLRYPEVDAERFAAALRLGAAALFDQKRTSIELLTTRGTAVLPPRKDTLEKAFARVRQQARPDDVLIVYLSGHAVTVSSVPDTYFYLTSEARTTDLRDRELRSQTAISSQELGEWLRRKGMPLKQVLILDTCAAGAAVDQIANLVQAREVSPDQRRAIEDLKDATGIHMLMGSAADAVSYEANTYGQGLLTYALLLGMQGAALEDSGRAELARLFNFAQRQVVDLAKGLGAIQKPIISTPKGQSFPIALLAPQDREKIQLSKAKPLVLRPDSAQDNGDSDTLQLGAALRRRLREISTPVLAPPTEPSFDPAVVYVDPLVDDVPGAFRPYIRYRIEASELTLAIRIVRGGRPIQEETVRLPLSKIDAVANVVAERIVELVKGVQ